MCFFEVLMNTNIMNNKSKNSVYSIIFEIFSKFCSWLFTGIRGNCTKYWYSFCYIFRRGIKILRRCKILICSTIKSHNQIKSLFSQIWPSLICSVSDLTFWTKVSWSLSKAHGYEFPVLKKFGQQVYFLHNQLKCAH